MGFVNMFILDRTIFDVIFSFVHCNLTVVDDNKVFIYIERLGKVEQRVNVTN